MSGSFRLQSAGPALLAIAEPAVTDFVEPDEDVATTNTSGQMEFRLTADRRRILVSVASARDRDRVSRRASEEIE